MNAPVAKKSDRSTLTIPDDHVVRATPATVHWGYIDPLAKPVLTVRPGSRVRIETVSSGLARMPKDRQRFPVLEDHLEIVRSLEPRLGPHILTGPVAIGGAVAGDLLSVHIEAVELRQNWAWNEISPGSGILPEIETLTEVATIPLDLDRGQVRLPWGAAVSARPFFGVMAVFPAGDEAVTSLIPGMFGGNMDIKLLGEGTVVHFPVNHAGAGFLCGDGHALQGDGEVNGTAAETALTGVFRFDLTPGGASLPFPFAERPGELITMAVDEDLEKAAVLALSQAVTMLQRLFGLNAQDAYRHASLAGDLIISQLVNVRKGVHCRVDVSPLRST